MSKFYHVANCNRTINVGPHSLQFAPYEHTGTWLGVYATDKEDEIKELDYAARHKASGITEITQAEYENCVAKKKSASNGYTQSLAVSTPTPGQLAPSANQSVDTVPVDTVPVPVAAEPPPAPLETAAEATEVVQLPPKNGHSAVAA